MRAVIHSDPEAVDEFAAEPSGHQRARPSSRFHASSTACAGSNVRLNLGEADHNGLRTQISYRD